jgi:hypothetical protein
LDQEEESSDNGHATDDDDENEDDDGDLDLAAEILDSVRIGSGARITCMSVWSSLSSAPTMEEQDTMVRTEDETKSQEDPIDDRANGGCVDEEIFSKKRNKKGNKDNSKYVETANKADSVVETLDKHSLEKARALVKQAKKHQRRMKEKKAKTSK